MKRRIFTAMAVLAFSAFGMNAQTLQSTTWKAYGISFKAPAGFNVEDDSEEGYIISTPTYYITVQLLEGEGIKRSELSQELKNIASDDEVTNQTPVTTFELPQFYGAQLKGNCETEQCIYSYLLTKDGSSGFYVSITYTDKQDNTPENILKYYCPIKILQSHKIRADFICEVSPFSLDFSRQTIKSNYGQKYTF